MKILKLLNKKNFLFFLFFIIFVSTKSEANEPVDIWNIDKTKTVDENNVQNSSSTSEEIAEENLSVYDLNNLKENNNNNQVLLENNLENKITLYGLYDPDENNLSIDMWNKSEGNEIKNIFSKIFMKNLSNDALDILQIVLLTNANTPENNIRKDEFYNYQKKFLIKKKRF